MARSHVFRRRVRSIRRRVIPLGLVRIWTHAQSKLRLNKSATERANRETFFDLAFTALHFNGIDGDYAEFGCHGGYTFAQAYHQARRRKHPAHLWGFDSFRGLPAPSGPEDAHPRFRAGRLATSVEDFHRICRVNRVPRSAYEVVEGYFEDTIAKLSPSDPPTDLCLAYIDCDLYSSTRTVLEFLAPRLKHGMILAFDDYYCWSPTAAAGERVAIAEFFDGHERWNLVPYLQFGWHGASFVVEDRALLRAGRAPPR
jgi:hypothetical protein